MVGEFESVKIKTSFLCPNGHEYKALPRKQIDSSHKNGNGCPTCHGTDKWKSEDNRRNKLKELGLRLMGDFKSTSHINKFRCDDCCQVFEICSAYVFCHDLKCPTCKQHKERSERLFDLLKEKRLTLKKSPPLGFKLESLPLSCICNDCGSDVETDYKNLRYAMGNNCRKCGPPQSDNDAIYLWKVIGEFRNGVQVYKVGITSARLGDQRIREVAKTHGFDFEIEILAKTIGKATDLEGECLKIGTKLTDIIGDGATEFRALTELELRQVKRLMLWGTEEDLLAA